MLHKGMRGNLKSFPFSPALSYKEREFNPPFLKGRLGGITFPH